jgi:hypothetical protein
LAPVVEEEPLRRSIALPLDKRAALAHELLESLDQSEADPAAGEAWARLIEQRAREVEDGSAPLVEWSEVRERLIARWRR